MRSFMALMMVMSFGAVGSASPQQPKPKSFAQWCSQKKSVPAATRHTINVLLKKAGTKNCQRADVKLRSLTELQLNDNKIVDVQPLAGLSNLTSLLLSENQIVDVQSLARLSNLTSLFLSDNKIVDVKPLAGLSNLTVLSLGANQIIDVKPLAGLSNLTDLLLDDNKIAIKTCPIKPESICSF